MGFETAAILLAWVAIALLGLALAGLMRQVQWLSAGGRSLERIGPAPRSYAFALPDVDYAVSRGTLIVFLADECPLCAELAPEAERLAFSAGVEGVRVVVARVGADGSDGPATISITDEQLRLWRVSVLPFAVLVGPDARIAETGPIESIASLQAIARRAGKLEEVAA